jgi:hypothetical protein
MSPLSADPNRDHAPRVSGIEPLDPRSCSAKPRSGHLLPLEEFRRHLKRCLRRGPGVDGYRTRNLHGRTK